MRLSSPFFSSSRLSLPLSESGMQSGVQSYEFSSVPPPEMRRCSEHVSVHTREGHPGEVYSETCGTITESSRKRRSDVAWLINGKKKTTAWR